MALSKAQLERSRERWIAREKTYKASEKDFREKAAAARAKAAEAHRMHKRREKEIVAAAQAAQALRVVMPVRHTDMAKNTNGWTGPDGHDGIDLLTPASEPLLAMCRSKVVRVSASGWWGNNPQPSPGHPISDGDGIIILESLVDAGPIKRGLHFCYGHAEHATVKVGATVEAGEVIGNAGFARAWHVHFMVNNDPPVNGLYRGVGDRDPMPYLDFAARAA